MLSSNLTGPGDDPLWAQLACLVAAVSYAFAATFAKTFKGIPPLVSATGQLMGSSLIMLPLALASAGTWSAFAYLICFLLLSDEGATNASLVTLIVPATAILFGFLVLGERLTSRQFAGLGLLLVGLIVLDGRVLRKKT